MKKLMAISFCVSLVANINVAQNNNLRYPIIKTDTSVDYFFGKRIIDPHRNLENLDDKLVKAWMKEQNELYDHIIHRISNHDTLVAEIQQLQKKRKKWADYPRVAENRVFYRFGYLDDPEIERIAYADNLNEDPIELFNTKEINNKDSSIYNIIYYEPSFDGKYIAFGLSPNGNEKANIYIVDVEKKQLLPECVEHSHLGNIQWGLDTGFFYVKDKEIINIEDEKRPNEDGKVMFHKLHTDNKQDKEIFSRSLNKSIGVSKEETPLLFTFPSSKYVLLVTIKGTYYSAIYYALSKEVLNENPENVQWKKICSENDKILNTVLFGDQFFGISFGQNQNGQLITIKLPNLEQKILYDAREYALDDMVTTKKELYITTIENGLNKLLRVDPTNYDVEKVKLPFGGYLNLKTSFNVASFSQNSNNLWFALTSYNKQWGEYIYKDKEVIKTNVFSEIQYMDPYFDIMVEEVEVPSYDGVAVPLSIVYKKGIKLNSNNPTLIEAYGAFGIPAMPNFNRNRLAWFKNGGIYAVAHVRGGGEKGDSWYKGGLKATKPNSWKDLIACAEYLIKKKYTSTNNLAVSGGSAGGITAGRAITERPDLFKAAVIYVGLLNTIRLENTANPYESEFGSVKDSIEFKYLYEMDTYHHISKGVNYPSILFTASLNDFRVPAWQTSKAAAKMQQVSKDNIVLFRIQDKGHFDYPSEADIYSFLFWQLGHPAFKLRIEENSL